MQMHSLAQSPLWESHHVKGGPDPCSSPPLSWILEVLPSALLYYVLQNDSWEGRTKGLKLVPKTACYTRTNGVSRPCPGSHEPVWQPGVGGSEVR